jgi:ATPase subunit of ABC transporter with duplicated ATPase domains
MIREIGNDVLQVQDLSHSKENKIILLGDELAKSALLRILAEEEEPNEGSIRWSITTTLAYFPLYNAKDFKRSEPSLVDWLRQYSPDDDSETFLRGFLGRMLFSGEEVKKKPLLM